MSCSTIFLSALRSVTNGGSGPPSCFESCTKFRNGLSHHHALTRAELGVGFVIFLTPDRLAHFFCVRSSLTKLRAPSSAGMMPNKQNSGYHGSSYVQAWSKATSSRMIRHVGNLKGLIWKEGSGFANTCATSLRFLSLIDGEPKKMEVAEVPVHGYAGRLDRRFLRCTAVQNPISQPRCRARNRLS